MRAMLYIAVGVVLLGCQPKKPTVPVVPLPHTTHDPQALEVAGLHNVYRVSAKLISGSGPEGDEAFRALQELGVRTIISVDGAKPDVARAKRFGLRYVHLPIGYDGVPTAQGQQLAKAVDVLPGPIYIHCHHGKHRSPAAVVAIQRCLDEQCTAERAMAWLRTAGTDPNYKGLHAAPTQFTFLREEARQALAQDFPETAMVNALVDCMVTIDSRWDNLKKVRAAAWRTPPQHADLDPPHEALLLREGYREAMRLLPKDHAMRPLMTLAEEQAHALQQSLQMPVNPSEAQKAFERSASLCTQCHRTHRDMPK